METIDISKLSFNSFIEWAVVHSMVNAKGGYKKNFTDARADNLTVELKINGVEVPFMQTLLDIEKQLDEMIERKAKEFLLDHFGILQNKIAEVERIIDQNFEDMLKED